MYKDEDVSIEVIKDYLKVHNYKATFECFEKESKLVKVNEKATKPKDQEEPIIESKLIKLVQNDRDKFKETLKLTENFKLLEKKYKSMVLCSRQIFSIAINCIQQLHNVKDGNNTDNLSEAIETYKSQIGRYQKIIMSDEWDEKTELISQAVMAEHKKKLKKAKEDKNNENIVEVLLSLRVNALQIAPELRKNLVYEIIKNDLFLIEENKSNSFVTDLLGIHSYSVKQATLATLSVIAATFKGIEYLSSQGSSIIEKVIEIMKIQEDGTVLQRFCLAFLQKISIKDEIIPYFAKYNLIDFLVNLLQKSRQNEIHIFCLDFGSALLANILQSNSTLEYLENNIGICKTLTDNFLNLVKENIPTSVLMHILVCLSNLSKDKFNLVKEEVKFYERISEFVESYSNIKTTTETAEVDKRTVLDLCAHMFHPKDNTMDVSEAMEINDMKYEDRIKEFENDQGDLIFECFQDEIS